MSAFNDLSNLCPTLVIDLQAAESASETSPAVALDKLADWVPLLIRVILAFEGIDEPADGNPSISMNRLNNRGLLPAALLPFFDLLSAHDPLSGLSESAIRMRAKISMKIASRLAIWFLKSYGPYLPPEVSSASNDNALVQAVREVPPTDGQRRSARKTALQRAATMQLTEEETRVIIDHQLRSVGWQADTGSLRYSNGTRPEKNANKAIAEWHTESGPADYALFAGLDFIGVIEAKKMGKDVLSDLTQSKRYSRDALLDGQA